MIKKILIVEDDKNILFGLSELLTDENYQVSEAENGIAALELIKSQGLPDLVIMDMIMPRMNGWVFVRELRANYGATLPVIVMTAAADADQRARDVDAAAWIGKPFEVNDLLQLIRGIDRR